MWRRKFAFYMLSIFINILCANCSDCDIDKWLDTNRSFISVRLNRKAVNVLNELKSNKLGIIDCEKLSEAHKMLVKNANFDESRYVISESSNSSGEVEVDETEENGDVEKAEDEELIFRSSNEINNQNEISDSESKFSKGKMKISMLDNDDFGASKINRKIKIDKNHDIAISCAKQRASCTIRDYIITMTFGSSICTSDNLFENRKHSNKDNKKEITAKKMDDKKETPRNCKTSQTWALKSNCSRRKHPFIFTSTEHDDIYCDNNEGSYGETAKKISKQHSEQNEVIGDLDRKKRCQHLNQSDGTTTLENGSNEQSSNNRSVRPNDDVSVKSETNEHLDIDTCNKFIYYFGESLNISEATDKKKNTDKVFSKNIRNNKTSSSKSKERNFYDKKKTNCKRKRKTIETSQKPRTNASTNGKKSTSSTKIKSSRTKHVKGDINKRKLTEKKSKTLRTEKDSTSITMKKTKEGKEGRTLKSKESNKTRNIREEKHKRRISGRNDKSTGRKQVEKNTENKFSKTNEKSSKKNAKDHSSSVKQEKVSSRRTMKNEEERKVSVERKISKSEMSGDQATVKKVHVMNETEVEKKNETTNKRARAKEEKSKELKTMQPSPHLTANTKHSPVSSVTSNEANVEDDVPTVSGNSVPIAEPAYPSKPKLIPDEKLKSFLENSDDVPTIKLTTSMHDLLSLFTSTSVTNPLNIKVDKIENNVHQIEKDILKDKLDRAKEASMHQKLENNILQLENRVMVLTDTVKQLHEENRFLKESKEKLALPEKIEEQSQLSEKRMRSVRKYMADLEIRQDRRISKMKRSINSVQSSNAQLRARIKEQTVTINSLNEKVHNFETMRHSFTEKLKFHDDKFRSTHRYIIYIRSRLASMRKTIMKQKEQLKSVSVVQSSKTSRTVEMPKSGTKIDELKSSSLLDAEQVYAPSESNDDGRRDEVPVEERSEAFERVTANEKSNSRQQGGAEQERKESSSSEKQDDVKFRDCLDHLKDGNHEDSVRRIHVSGYNSPFDVYCDMKNGGWTVLLARVGSDENFFRSWEEYKNGFGNKEKSHWIGNDLMHRMTTSKDYKLQIELWDWSDTRKEANYEKFRIGDEPSGYPLEIGKYSGTAGDGLTRHSGERFSTFDKDNDRVEKKFGGNCAQRFHGAWWYYSCYKSQLTGKFYKNGKVETKRFDGIAWKPWKKANYSFKKVIMKILPIKNPS